MVLLESVSSEENNVLLNVDEIESVTRFDRRPQIYMNAGPHPYDRGLKITLRSGKIHLVETKMTLREFEIERAKKFTPVAEEETESGNNNERVGRQ
jgi:hypothetical protein